MNFSRADSHLSFPGYRAPWVKAADGSRYNRAFIASILLHIIFLALLASQHPTIIPEVIEIELTELPEPPSRKIAQQPQIVAPPDRQDNAEPPDKPAYRSDVDANTAVEQVKRGDGPDAGLPNSLSKSNAAQPQEEKVELPPKPEPLKKAPPAPKEKPVKPEPPSPAGDRGETIKESRQNQPLKQLALDDSTLLEKFSKPQPTKVPDNLASTRMTDPSRYQAFSRPPGTGARFIGQRGSSDYLPNLPDGDITLLNTKADQFAVFVRRVATQVFGEIRNTGWEVLNRSDLGSVTQFTTFRAVLSLQGKLLRVEQMSASGSSKFDRVIENAVKKGAKDSNPPAAAVAADGNIHFIFQAKSWSAASAHARTGAPMERRWLLLATGLE